MAHIFMLTTRPANLHHSAGHYQFTGPCLFLDVPDCAPDHLQCIDPTHIPWPDRGTVPCAQPTEVASSIHALGLPIRSLPACCLAWGSAWGSNYSAVPASRAKTYASDLTRGVGREGDSGRNGPDTPDIWARHHNNGPDSQIRPLLSQSRGVPPFLLHLPSGPPCGISSHRGHLTTDTPHPGPHSPTRGHGGGMRRMQDDGVWMVFSGRDRRGLYRVPRRTSVAREAALPFGRGQPVKCVGGQGVSASATGAARVLIALYLGRSFSLLHDSELAFIRDNYLFIYGH